MKTLKFFTITLILSGFSCFAAAQEAGKSQFYYVSDLVIDEFEPFAVSSSANVSFGMRKGSDMYLCFLADSQDLAAERRAIVARAIWDDEASREVPNITVVCVQAQ